MNTPRPANFQRRCLTLALWASGLLPCTALALPAATSAGDDASQPATYTAPTFSDWGDTGLWQTPTARMAPAGELAFTASHVTPYTRYDFLLQPFAWFEAVFRYSDINNRPYGVPSLSGNQTYKDKSIDARVRLWRETQYRPAVAVGIRDVAGTGLFSGEYVVANKRFGSIDASLGLGWGYIGARGDLPNPFNVFSDKFRVRPKVTPHSGGEFDAHTYFRGRTAVFGGISWQTPLQKLIVKVEYDGNNYQHEPLGDNQKQSSPWNVGLVYRLSGNVDVSAAFERGNTALFSLSLHANLAQLGSMAKPLDPPPLALPNHAPTATPAEVDWPGVARELQQNAGITVSTIAQRGHELVVTGDPERYYFRAQTLGRMARVLDQYLGSDIDWYSLDATRDGMPVVESSVDRARFQALVDHRISTQQLSYAVALDQPLPAPETVLYRAPQTHYHGGVAMGYEQSVGGPNAFVLYEINANYDATYHFTPGIWWSGNFSANLINNYNKYTYTAPSNLPRVRTFIREYLTSSRITMPVFQLSAARRLAPDWYGMAYGGMLEMMYGGIGGEVLYRPFGERWAIGADVNWVRQRSFSQGFSFRKYHVATGLVTGYFNTNFHHTLLKISAGRYLAGDWGTTIDVSRRFRNGTRIGAYATFTTADGKQFGEGSFDKGIYISIPFELMLPRSTQSVANLEWEPLLRDGGARLNRVYTLYQLTQGRDGDNFYDNLKRITH